MKQKLVSGLGILLVLPAFAGARLPAVNTAKTAVSARAQYGAPVPVVAKNVTAQPVAVESTTRTATNKKRVVARTAKSKPAPSKNISVDTGEKIAANNEYLIPNRPSPDLWAKNDTPLRMPRANEFSVITSNDALPEEYIATAPIENEVAKLSAKTSSLDAQIARLMEMQKRADESIKSHRVSTSRPEEKIAYTAESAVLPESVTKPNITNTDDGVHIARVVVPRDDLIAACG